MAGQRFEVLGLGNAIVDAIAQAEDDFLAHEGLNKGGMALIDESRASSLYARMGAATIMSGGSAANTARGLSAGFDIRTSLISAVGKDEWGALFTSSMHRAGVDTSGTIVREGTFICISIRAIRLTACFLFRSRRSNRPMRLPGR